MELEVQLKEETEDKYKCLLTFTSNDEENKIKQIEYPNEEEKTPNIITIASEEGNTKVTIDYEFNKKDINKTFKVKTKNGEVIPKRTCYIITYDPNDGINPPKEDTVLLGSNTVLTKEQPTKEAEVFWGWSEDKSVGKPDYLKGSEFINVDNKEDITLYAIWENQDKGIIRYLSSETVNENGIYSTTALGIKYNFEVTYLTPSNVSAYGGSYNASTNTYTINDLNLGTAEGITINGEKTQAMAVLKCDGNLTINGKVTTSTYSETLNGVTGNVTKVKGLFIYCSGTLTNNGTITQTARGTYETEGEDIYLWSNKSSYENYTVPKIGAPGGNNVGAWASTVNGHKGIDGGNRQSGGGGSGAAYSSSSSTPAYSGSGSTGTSYSGGGGGGGAGAREANSRSAGHASKLCLGGAGGSVAHGSRRPARRWSRDHWGFWI